MNPLATPVDSAAPLSVSALAGAHVPAAVRDNAPGARQAYATAQSFEELLLGQLSQSLLQSSGLSGEGEGGGDGQSAGGESGMVASLLPQTLTEGVMRAGGLGLAAQMMQAINPQLEAGAGTSAPLTDGAGSPRASAGGGSAYSPAGSFASTGGASA